jgi:hypothetical protein
MASCDDFADVTKSFERFVARDVAWAFRAKHKIQSRRKYPTAFPFHISGGSGAGVVNVSLSEHHGLLTLPALDAPGLLKGFAELSQQPTYSIKPWHYPPLQKLQPYANLHGGRGLATGPINALSMARLVAKIAHSCCVAEGRIGPMEGLLPAVVLETASNALWLVGGSMDEQPAADELHVVVCEEQSTSFGDFLVCRVQLFACLGGPAYLSVVKQL